MDLSAPAELSAFSVHSLNLSQSEKFRSKVIICVLLMEDKAKKKPVSRSDCCIMFDSFACTT